MGKKRLNAESATIEVPGSGPGASGCSGSQCPMSGSISQSEPPQVAGEVERHWERWGWGPSPSLALERLEKVW